MEKERKTKLTMIAVLFVAVVALSVGFAAFSKTLAIKSSADYKPSNSALNVLFSSSSTEQATNSVTSTPANLGNASGATIVNGDNPTISGLEAHFTAKGQSVSYTFYAHNDSDYTAYLNSVSFAALSGSDTKVCTASTGTTESMVKSSCDDIELSIKVNQDEALSQTSNDISGHTLAPGAYEPVVVTISYSNSSNTPTPDGDFTVKFGDISLLYSTAD